MSELYQGYKEIQVKVEDRVGIIRININGDSEMGLFMMEEIYDVLKKFEQDKEIRCVMLTHNEKDFSVGCATAEQAALDSGMTHDEVTAKFTAVGSGLVEYIDQYPKPTLVAGKGMCYGGAAAVYQAFDIRIAGESFHLYDGDLYWGIASNWGMCTLRLPLWLGRNKIMDFMFLNEYFYGRQLYELGIVSRVIPDDYVEHDALKLAKKMATTSPLTVAEFKKVVHNAVYGGRYEQLKQFERESAARHNSSEDFKHALEATLKGEKYDFQGR